MIQDLISVVVPFVNHRDFIIPCWEKLREQTYDKTEILFIDNGSSDGSAELVSSLGTEFPGKVWLIRETRQGIPFARNRGLLEAKGEFVSFLDVDDHFTPGKLSKLHEMLIAFPEAAMAFGQTLRIYKESGREVIQDSGAAIPGLNQPPHLAIDWTRSFYRLPQTGATLIRTQAARRAGGFPEHLLLGNDDAGFHIRLALDNPVVYHPFVAVHYFRHERSEGARLNESDGVHLRYLDIYRNFVLPAAKKYYDESGNAEMLGLAWRGLFRNFIDLRGNPGSRDISTVTEPLLPSYYRLMVAIHSTLPLWMANSIYKTTRRLMNWLSPQRYPLL